MHQFSLESASRAVSRWTEVALRNPAAILVAASIGSMGIGIGNQLAQDDIPIILKNPAVAHPGFDAFIKAYWPPGFSPDLYRPFGTLTLALQWHLSAQHPWVLHAVSIVLYAAVVLATWGLLRRLAPPAPAFLAALLFAVHPVHVESVAVAVNQGELMVALILTLCTSAYIDARRGGTLSNRRLISFLLAFGVACLFKEHAIVLPALLVACELTILRTVTPDRRMQRQRLRLGVWLLTFAGIFLLIRTLVLQNFTGTFAAEAFYGLGQGGRVTTMLGVVPIWFRLLLWPAHLQADYSPQEVVAVTGLGGWQWLGLALLAATALATILAWRRAPSVSFGLLWAAIALAPVSNILLPTGITVAERTLFLPSVGVAIVAAVLLSWLARQWNDVRPSVRQLGMAGFCLLAFAGLLRSATRMRVWNNQEYLWQRTLEDAPASYRAHHTVAQIARNHQVKGLAEYHFRRAIELWPRGYGIMTDLGDLYRDAGLCEPAVVQYERALEVAPGRSATRLSLVSCLLWLGRYSEARGQARMGKAWEHERPYFERAMDLADSATATSAPAHSIRMPAFPGSTVTAIGSSRPAQDAS